MTVSSSEDTLIRVGFFSPINSLQKSQKIILFVPVNNDGFGDFSHFVDIYTALKNNKRLKNYELISLVASYPEQYEQIKKELEKEGIENYFLGTMKEYETTIYLNELVQQHLLEAEQFIQISFAAFPAIEKYMAFNKKATYKFISEHEYGGSHSLGLSENMLGIKLKKTERLEPLEATALMQDNDLVFSQALLAFTKSSSFQDFHKYNFLVPAYFNKMSSFVQFLLFLGINEKVPKDKEIAIYLSGAGLCSSYGILTNDMENPSIEEIKKKYPQLIGNSEFALSFNCGLNTYLKDSHIKTIELIESTQPDPAVFLFNPKGSLTIRVFYGFYLTNHSYDALYRQAKLAGVSGDTTLERVISSGGFLWYQSTNWMMKKKTLQSLEAIIRKLDIEEPIKADLIDYFSGMNTFASAHQDSHMMEKYKQFDLLGMMAAWPMVVEYLFAHHNFYDQLEEVVLEGPSQTIKMSQALR